jgi:hypothetical protein
VQLLPGKSASEAIDIMFDHQDRWQISCGEFVQIAEIYARSGTRSVAKSSTRASTTGRSHCRSGAEHRAVSIERSSSTAKRPASLSRAPTPGKSIHVRSTAF